MVFVKTYHIQGGTMSHYKHLTPIEREKIFLLHSQNKTLSYIAKIIHRDKSTVSREIARNGYNGAYSPSAAHTKYLERRTNCKPKLKFSNPEIFKYVRDKFLELKWSPEQICGRLKLEKSDLYVSYTTIYRAIYSGKFDTDKERASNGNRGAIRKLRHRGKSRHTKGYIEKRGKIPISNNISDRPQEANNRIRIGDREADTVIGKSGGACLVTLVDRKSRFLISSKAKKKDSVSVKDTMISCLTGNLVIQLHLVEVWNLQNMLKFLWHSKKLNFIFHCHIILGNEEQMKIQMDFLESIFLRVTTLMMCQKNIYKAKWMK